MDIPCCVHAVGAPVDCLCGWRVGGRVTPLQRSCRRVGRGGGLVWPPIAGLSSGGKLGRCCSPGIAAANDGSDHRFDLSHGEPRFAFGIQQLVSLSNFRGGEALSEQGQN